jgi:subtilisin family serine protease
VVGVAAGISLVPVKVLANNGSGRFSWSIDGFDYVRKKGSSGDVVNYSVGPGSRYTSTTLDKAVKNLAAAGFKVCLAAGNSADDATYYSPARVNETNVYTIASMDEYTVFSDFSNYGSCVDWIEPGEGVLSTYKNNKYATGSGTSMATPHATGILAAGGIESGGTVTSVPSNTTTDWGKRN